MKKINELYIFDLDETLLRVPSYTDKFAVERLNPDISFNTPYEFYDHPLSLCDTINNIQLIEPIYREWEEANADLSCGHALITHRVFDQKNTVIDLLKRKGVVFDHTYFLGRASAKSNCLHYILNEVYYIEEIKKIKIFEDSIDQIAKYQQYFSENNYDIEVEYWIVDKARVFKIGEVQLSDKKRITLI